MSIERLMQLESKEVTGNGREKAFAECPSCGQKLLNVVSSEGATEVIVKCRRCHHFVLVRVKP